MQKFLTVKWLLVALVVLLVWFWVKRQKPIKQKEAPVFDFNTGATPTSAEAAALLESGYAWDRGRSWWDAIRT